MLPVDHMQTTNHLSERARTQSVFTLRPWRVIVVPVFKIKQVSLYHSVTGTPLSAKIFRTCPCLSLYCGKESQGSSHNAGLNLPRLRLRATGITHRFSICINCFGSVIATVGITIRSKFFDKIVPHFYGHIR